MTKKYINDKTDAVIVVDYEPVIGTSTVPCGMPCEHESKSVSVLLPIKTGRNSYAYLQLTPVQVHDLSVQVANLQNNKYIFHKEDKLPF